MTLLEAETWNQYWHTPFHRLDRTDFVRNWYSMPSKNKEFIIGYLNKIHGTNR